MRAKSSQSGDKPLYGRVPWAVIETGAVRKLKGADAKVYLILAAHARNDDWIVFPSVARIMALTGLTRRAAQVSMGRLETLKLIVCVQRGGGSGFSTRYRLENSAPPCAVSGNEVQVEGGQRRTVGTGTAHPDAPNGASPSALINMNVEKKKDTDSPPPSLEASSASPRKHDFAGLRLSRAGRQKRTDDRKRKDASNWSAGLSREQWRAAYDAAHGTRTTDLERLALVDASRRSPDAILKVYEHDKANRFNQPNEIPSDVETIACEATMTPCELLSNDSTPPTGMGMGAG